MRAGILLMVLGMVLCCTTDSKETTEICEPGRHIPCKCSDDSSSFQVCNNTGQAFGVCDCEDSGNQEPACTKNADCIDSGLKAGVCQQVTCDVDDKSCRITVKPAGGSCDDGNECTLNDTCSDLGCQGQAMDCNDESLCTTDTCENGECRNLPSNDSAACSDGDLCTINDVCLDGDCIGTAKPCDNGNVCLLRECQGGLCVNTGFNVDKGCDDGDLCTLSDACGTNGDCVGVGLQCNDDNPCTEDSCDKFSGECQFQNVVDGAECPSDDDPCTGDGCQSGLCNQPLAEGTECEDGNACTSHSQCWVGLCQGTSNLLCDDGNGCTNDSCDPVLGCVFQAAASGTSCEDGDSCTLDDQCVGSVCSGESFCDDGCDLTADSCQEAECSYEWVADCGNGVVDSGEDCDPGWNQSSTWGGKLWGCSQDVPSNAGGFGCDVSCKFQLFDTASQVSFPVSQSFSESSGDVFADGSFVTVWVSEPSGSLNGKVTCQEDSECPADYLCGKSTCQKGSWVRGVVYNSSGQPLKSTAKGSVPFTPSFSSQGHPFGKPVVSVSPNQTHFAVGFLTQSKGGVGSNGYSLRIYQINSDTQEAWLTSSVDRDFGDAEMIHLNLAWSPNGKNLAVLHNRLGKLNQMAFTESWLELTEYSFGQGGEGLEQESYKLTELLILLHGEQYLAAVVMDDCKMVYRSDGKIAVLAHGTYGDDVWAFRLDEGAIEQAKELPVAINNLSNKSTVMSATLPGLAAIADSDEVLVSWPANMGSKKGIEWRRYNFTFLAVDGGFISEGATTLSSCLGWAKEHLYFLCWRSVWGDSYAWLDVQDGSVTESKLLPPGMEVANRAFGNGRVLLMDGVNALVKTANPQ
jgi:hypothetical protein